VGQGVSGAAGGGQSPHQRGGQGFVERVLAGQSGEWPDHHGGVAGV
jgi:hypothetical protein